MKRILLLFTFFTLTLLTNAQIGIQTNSPDASAALDIVATDKGLLIPRVTLTNDLTNASPITSPATGLLVFNTGANQAVGLYFWDGSSWNLFNAGSISSDYWNLAGNAGTTVGTNFIGTTDAVDFATFTNNTERMRFTSGGQGLIGLSTPIYSSDFVTIQANATQNYALNISSPYVGLYSDATDYGVYGLGGSVAVRGVGGTYGVYATGTGRGVLGSVDANTGSGGWFENQAAVDGNGEGSWGAFFVGSGLGSGYTLQYHSAGLTSSGNDGIFAAGKATDGIGIIAGGNAVTTFSTLNTGCGGAFTGYHGVYGSATSSSDGVGVIGVGNDHGTYNTTSSGSGGAFTGYHGLIATAYDDNGTGVIGVGNGGSYTLAPTASGGAFSGEVCGVFGYATNTSGDRYGGYFATGSGRYAYVGGRYGGTNRKIVGNGTVSTIVKNTKGEIVTLVCPEAPEAVFQDFGISQLVDGYAHITIDPDLAINLNVSEDHPLKVYVTLEGDCNGVYVTNKSVNGFDVKELQGGQSNVQFSWQIVATRANEEYQLRDGSYETSDYSQRFQPAPPPLEDLQQPLKAPVKTKSEKVNHQEIKSQNIDQDIPNKTKQE